MTAITSTTGVASGLDVDAIVTALVTGESGTLTKLTQQQTAYNAKVSAYGTLTSALSTFQTAIAKLSTASGFNSLLAKASDSSVFTATATSNATVGSYSVNVSQLAQQQKLSSSGFASTNSAIGSGTLTISFGSYDSGTNTFSANGAGSTTSINITSGNNTLSGVRDAINAAGAGVTATIINDGSTNRLVVTSTATGTSNSIKIDVTDSDGNSTDATGLSQLAYDPTATVGSGKNMTEKQAAKDALLTIDGIAVTKSSNTITDAIDGVTLKLVKESAGSNVSLDVTKDTTTVQASVQAFVDAYNALDSKIRTLTKFVAVDSTSNGELLGDSTARAISTQLKNIMTQAVTGAGSYTTLSQIGVAFQSDGTLKLDTTKLATAMDSNFSDIAALFSTSSTSTDALVKVTGNSTSTKPGSYAVNITQAAQQASLLGSSGPNLNIVAGVNDHLDLNISGVSYGINVAAGSYANTADLIAAIQAKLTAAGAKASVSLDSGALKITTTNYGASESVAITGGNGATDLFGGSPTAVAGLDVAGTINGVAATGTGQSLVSTSGDSTGLIVNITGATLGSRGTVTYAQGAAYKLNQYAQQMLGSDGLIEARTDGLATSLDRIADQIDEQNVRLAKVEARYRAQFASLETLISSMQTTSSYLTQQIAQFNANSK